MPLWCVADIQCNLCASVEEKNVTVLCPSLPVVCSPMDIVSYRESTSDLSTELFGALTFLCVFPSTSVWGVALLLPLEG